MDQWLDRNDRATTPTLFSDCFQVKLTVLYIPNSYAYRKTECRICVCFELGDCI